MPPVLDGFEAQQGVVDAAQLSGGDKDKRVLLLRNVVYRQEIFGKGNHQTAGAFYEHGIIAMGKFPGGTLYFFEVYRALVYGGRRGGGSRGRRISRAWSAPLCLPAGSRFR